MEYWTGNKDGINMKDMMEMKNSRIERIIKKNEKMRMYDQLETEKRENKE